MTTKPDKPEPKKPTTDERLDLIEKAILTGDPVAAAQMLKAGKK